MKILIIGGGAVGSTVAKNLSSQSHNAITVIDKNEKVLQELNEQLDIQTILGNASSPSILKEGGAEDTDLFLALTGVDDTNLVSCLLAKNVFNIPHTIARIRHSDIVEYEFESSLNKDTDDEKDHTTLPLLGVNKSICPEQIITERLFELFHYSNALQVINFSNGFVQMVVTRAQSGGKLTGQLISESNNILSGEVFCHICAIYRNESLVIPTQKTKLIHGDEVFFLTKKEYVHIILQAMSPNQRPTKNIMIAGGGNIGYRLAKMAEELYNVKVIEKNQKRAEWISENLNSSLILHGSSTDESILEKENIEDIDVFCALSNDDEDNIMSSLLAKNYGAKRVVTIINRTSYVDLLLGNTIDIVVSPHFATIGSVLAYIRRGDVVSVNPLRRGEAELIEFIIHGDKKTSRLIGRKPTQINWPHGCYVASIYRNNIFVKEIENHIFEEGDHIIFFVHRHQVVPEIEKLLQVKWRFF